ncbi:MAG: tyrosine-type recombinase/integrase [Clostridiales bacterium]|jgi:site-specific recombinase XerD|nr:tyrosine-type recombinase/integrase [Clostridiales bacterium]
MSDNYHEDVHRQSTIKLRRRLRELPPFVQDFFRGVSDTTSIQTRIGYVYDLKIFFTFLSEERVEMEGKAIDAFDPQDLQKITVDAIEEFMEYLNYYIRNEKTKSLEFQNTEQGKSRKLSAVRTFLNYFYKKGDIVSNPAMLVDLPKLHEKSIIRLEVDEIARLLDEAESGAHLSDRQKLYHQHTKTRDAAILTLLLGTGMRVSECVGVNISDVDFAVNGVKVTRKGGNETILYFSGEVERALRDYLETRLDEPARESDRAALFLSLQNRRISVRAVELLVKKYARLVNPLKKISPHKLRSTFGTQLYHETGDIYLVADVLGHADINTTIQHYAAMDDEKRRSAARRVKLREE